VLICFNKFSTSFEKHK